MTVASLVFYFISAFLIGVLLSFFIAWLIKIKRIKEANKHGNQKEKRIVPAKPTGPYGNEGGGSDGSTETIYRGTPRKDVSPPSGNIAVAEQLEGHGRVSDDVARSSGGNRKAITLTKP